jgi:MFS family permease
VPVAPIARDAVVSAYYPDALKAAETARTRAQTAYTIASAVAAALVAAGIFGDISKEQGWVKDVGFAALLGWLVAAGMFIFAITASVNPVVQGTQGDVDSFVIGVLQNVAAERKTVTDRQNRAYGATAVAILLTAVTIGGVAFSTAPSRLQAGELLVARREIAWLRDLCPDVTSPLKARFDPDKLGSEYLSVTVDSATCSTNGPTDLRLPKAVVGAAALTGK